MRWDDLFADLSGQARFAADAALGAEVSEQVRGEYGRARLLERMRSAGARRVQLGLVGATDLLDGRLAAVGADWVVVVVSPGETLVPRGAVRSVRFPPHDALTGPPRSLDVPLHPRLRIGHAVRRLVRDRARVQVRSVDGGLLSGTLDRAAHDHLEIAEHPADESRRSGAVRAVTLLPYSAVVWVRGGSVWGAPR